VYIIQLNNLILRLPNDLSKSMYISSYKIPIIAFRHSHFSYISSY
jgi:hypothetical protein